MWPHLDIGHCELAVHPELEAGPRRAVGVEKHVGELWWERWMSGLGGETILTYQEEHSLLVALPRQLLQTALPHELAAGGDQVIVTHQVPLQLHQLHEVLLPCQVVESFGRRR